MAPLLFLGLLWLSRCGALRSSVQSRLEASCGTARLQTAAKVIGIEVDGSFDVGQLAEAVNQPRNDLWDLMQKMDLRERNSLVDFCRAAMASMRHILGQEAPLPDMACLDHGCHKEVSISFDDLAKLPLVPPPPELDYIKDPQGAEVVKARKLQKPEISGMSEAVRRSKKSTEDLLRHVTQRLFQVILLPSISDMEEDSNTSVLQTYADPKFASDGYEVREKNKENFLEGAGVATKYLEVATNFFQSHGLFPGRVDVIFRQWFKSDTVPVKRMVADHLGNILEVLQNLRVHGDSIGESIECNESSAAYVSTYCDFNVSALPSVSEDPCGERYPKPFEVAGRYVVHVCPPTWKQNVIFHAGNLVHESSHHFGTVDFAYGMTGCMALDQSKALSNADTYIYFVQHLYAMIRDEAWTSYRGLTSGDRGVHESKYALPEKKPQPAPDLSWRDYLDIFVR
ncbi:unnamed protein product [Symbiodinium sp. CCMP2592]|nr:unnamed protein product [Symbiodinium sp. CCMP2592]